MIHNTRHIIIGCFTRLADAEQAFEDLRTSELEIADLSIARQTESGVTLEKAPQSDGENQPNGFWEAVMKFFQADIPYDPYFKERRGPESFRTAGDPCHGGYSDHQACSLIEDLNLNSAQEGLLLQRITQANSAAVVFMATTERRQQAEEIIRSHAGCSTILVQRS